MKLTPILYVRSWIAKLHPPMLPTAKENKQLLSLLSTSFQRQLDAAHPPIQPVEPITVLPSDPPIDNRPARAMIDHLQSLLQHPLLAQKAIGQIEGQSVVAQAATMMDQAMLRGKIDLGMVDRCMQVYMKTLCIRQMSVKDEFRLGRRIAAWFTSSKASVKDEFLSSSNLLRNAVPILYADGLEETVWEWLGMLYSRKVDGNDLRSTTKPVRWVLQETYLTFLMIKEALRRSRLDAAVLQFTQACDYMHKTGRMSPEARSSQAWQSVTKAVTIALLRRRHQHGLSDQLFNSFLEHQSLWSDCVPFAFALISLYHPTQPSAKELANAVSQEKEQVQSHFNLVYTASGTAQKILVNALLDGAHLLLEQNSSSVPEARLILHLIEKQPPMLANTRHNEATQKRTPETNPQPFMPAAMGLT